MVFHTKLLLSSIFQLLECNKLEVSLEEYLHSIVFDRKLILFFDRKININPEYRVLMFFHVLRTYRALRGTEKSIYSGSL